MNQPAVPPTLSQVELKETFSSESIVKAQPSTTMSCVAARNVNVKKIDVNKGILPPPSDLLPFSFFIYLMFSLFLVVLGML